jgi:hypothetical protein
MYRLQRTKLFHDEKQAEHAGSVGAEKILQAMPEAHATQRS